MLLGVALVMAPGLNADLPDRDAGVFLYAGSQIREGHIPYRDFWDHKGPLIYYINALGVSLSPGSEVGVWLLEGTALLGAGGGLYWVLRRVFGGTTSALASVAFFGGVGFTLVPGNYTEEFALPLQVAALILFVRADEHSPHHLHWFLIGLTAAAAILLRPDNASLQAGMAIYLVLHGRADRRTLPMLGWLGLGMLVIIVPAGAYLAATGGLEPMLDALVRYNAVYVSSSLKARLDAVFEGLRLLAPTGLTLLATAAWVIVFFKARIGASNLTRTRLLKLAVIALPLQMALVALAGRSLNHYYLNWLPIMAVLSAGLFSELSALAADSSKTTGIPRSQRTAWAVGFALALAVLPARRLLPPFFELLQSGPRRPAALVSDLKDYRSPYLLMWGAEAAYNFLTAVPSPTRYVYQYPLYTCGYFTDESLQQFRRDIVERRPLIVDSSSSNQAVPPIDAEQRANWADTSDNCALSAGMLELLGYIEANYELVGRTRYAGWPIYQFGN